MLRRWFWYIFAAAWLGAIWIAASLGQTSSPLTITSLQSSPLTSNIPTLGNAITSGTDPTDVNGFRLYINGTFNTNNTHTVTWANTSTNVTTIFTLENGILSVFPTQIVVAIPSALFSTPVSSAVTVNVRVSEEFEANNAPAPVLSNSSPFLIYPPMASTGPVLPSGTVGVPYAQNLLNVGTGTAPFTASVSAGALPPGLSLVLPPQPATATANLGKQAVIDVAASVGPAATATAHLGTPAAATATPGAQAVINASQGSPPTVLLTQGVTATGTITYFPGEFQPPQIVIATPGTGYPANANIPWVISQVQCSVTGYAVTDSSGDITNSSVVVITIPGASCDLQVPYPMTFPNAGIVGYTFASGAGLYDAAPSLNSPSITPGATNNSVALCNQAVGYSVPQFTVGLTNNLLGPFVIANPGYGCTAAPTITFPAPGIRETLKPAGTAYGSTPTIALTGTTCTTLPTFTAGTGAGGAVTFTQHTYGSNCTQLQNPVVEAPGILSVNVTNGGSGYQTAPSVTANCAVANPSLLVAAPVAGSFALGTSTITVNGNNYGAGCGATPITFNLAPPGIASVSVNAPSSGYTSPPPVTATGGGCAPEPLLTSTIDPSSGSVTAVNISGTNFGMGCTSAPTITMPAPTTGSLQILPGMTAGTGYSNSPLPPITLPSTVTCTTAPTLTAVVDNLGNLSGVTVTGGSECSGTGPLNIPAPGVTSATITNVASGYSASAPPNVIVSGGGCTVEPVGTAVVTGGAVTGITFAGGGNNFGYGCATQPPQPPVPPPTIMIAPPPGGPATVELAGTPALEGDFTFTVTIVDAWGNSNPFPYAVQVVAPPTVTTLAPNAVPAGSQSFQLAVTGTDFLASTAVFQGSQIVFGGVPLATTLVNPNPSGGCSSSCTLTATVPATSVVNAAYINVTVVNPGAPSASATFTVTPNPTVSSLQSSQLNSQTLLGNAITSGTNPTDVNGFLLYINGTFTATGVTHTVFWQNASVGIQSVTKSQIIVTIPSTLFSTLVSSQTAVNVTVTEQLPANASLPTPPPATSGTSNGTPFFINPPLAARGPVFPSGTVGVGYTQSLFTGGTAPFTVSLTSGALPAGLPLPTTGGPLTGTPAAAGDFIFSLQIADVWGNTLNPTDGLQVVGTPTITPPLAPSSVPAGTPGVQLAITGTNFLAPATVGNIQLNGSSTAEWTGAQPPTLITTVSSATQATASVPASLLQCPVTAGIVMVQPNGVSSNSVAFTVAAPAITLLTPSTVVAGLRGAASVQLTVSGSNFLSGSQVYYNGTPLNTTFVNSSSLTAVLPVSLVPAASPSGQAKVTVANSALPCATSAATTLTVVGVLTITSGPLPASQTGVSYTFTLTAIGGNMPYTWSATGLPPSLTLNPSTGNPSTGVISGTWAIAGSYPVTITVTDTPSAYYSGQTASTQSTVAATNPIVPLQITTTSPLPPATVGVPYGVSFSASGGTAPYTFSNNLQSGTLPAGLVYASGALGGTPTIPGQFTFTISVADSANGTASKSFLLVVAPATLTITTASLPNGQVGVVYSAQLAATGGVPVVSAAGVLSYTWQINGLPAGLGSSSSTGAISGTPTAPGSSSVSITVIDSAGTTASKSFTITVTAPPLTITGSLPNGQVGVPYSGQVAGAGGVPPLTLQITGLPAGLTPSSSGAVSGTPTAPGTSSVTVTVTDSATPTANKLTKSFSVTITPAALTIAGSLPSSGQVGKPYSAQFTATGGVPSFTWQLSGLPGVSVSNTGAVSGAPSQAGTFSSVTVTVTDSAVPPNTASQSFTVTVTAPLVITTTSLPGGVVGTAFSATLGATGGVQTYTWQIAGLPAGLTPSSAGVISGTPTAPGTSSVSVTVTDSAVPPNSATSTLPLTVVLPPAPPLTITGLSSTSSSLSQSTLQVGLGSIYPVAVTVNLTLTFTPNSGVDDPAVGFSIGSCTPLTQDAPVPSGCPLRTTSITVPAGQTAGATSVGVQTGSVAGVITITARLVAVGQDVTPTPAPSQTIQIPATAPVITSLTAASTSTGFTVTVVGYSNTRDVSQGVFVFTAASGANLQTGQVTVSLTSAFSAWFQSAAAAPFGGQFTLTQGFTVTGNQQAVSSVAVTLTNSVGTSASKTASVP